MYDLAGNDPALEEVESADDTFRELENEFKDVRSWLIKRQFRNWHKQIDFLLRYMHMICVRSPLYFEQTKEQGKSMLAATVQHVDAAANALTTSAFAPFTDDQIQNWTLGNMRQDIQKRGAWLWEFNWALRYTNSVEEPFVTIEQPLTLEGPRANLEEAIKDPESTLAFPICWQACLFGSVGRFHKGTDIYNGEALRVFRRKYRSYAKVFLLSPIRLNDITELPSTAAATAAPA
jgi:hypothetical protein